MGNEEVGDDIHFTIAASDPISDRIRNGKPRYARLPKPSSCGTINDETTPVRIDDSGCRRRRASGYRRSHRSSCDDDDDRNGGTIVCNEDDDDNSK
jgi:hypothetical protein